MKKASLPWSKNQEGASKSLRGIYNQAIGCFLSSKPGLVANSLISSMAALELRAVRGHAKGLHPLLDGKAFVYPIAGEVGWQHKNAQPLEAHVVKSGERRADVRAAFERAASAINDEIR